MNRQILNIQKLEVWSEIMPENWQEVVRDLIHVFIASSASQFVELTNARKQMDFEGIKRAAHSLKSSCGNVGAEEAHYLLNKIEALALEGNSKELLNLIDGFEIVFTSTMSELAKYEKRAHAA